MTEPSVNNVVVYFSPFCGYCAAAKQLLRGKGVEFTEINTSFNSENKQKMVALSGQKTVPQIFIGDRHIGGYTDLAALESNGELDPLLAGSTPA
jgi:glutaredoxin 3